MASKSGKKKRTAKKQVRKKGSKTAKKTAKKTKTVKKKVKARPAKAPKKAKKKQIKKARKKQVKKGPKKQVKKASVPAKAKKAKAKKPSSAARRPAAKTKAPPPRRMTKRQLAPYRKLLVAKQQALVQAYHNSKGETRNLGTDGTEDYIDYAVSSYTREFTLSLTEMERKQLRLVEEAIQRIDRGEYGHCLNCGKEIPDKRKEVEPWARFCVVCQELEEQGLLADRDFEPEESETAGESEADDELVLNVDDDHDDADDETG